MGQRPRPPQQKQLGSGHAHAHPQRIVAAGGTALPALWLACRRLRRLQNAASASGRPSRHQAARAGGQLLAFGQMPPANHAAPHSRPGMGLPLARTAIGAPCGEKRRGADWLSRAQKPLHRRYAQLRHFAAARQRLAFALAGANCQPGCSRHLPPNRTGLRRCRHSAGVAPSGAAQRSRYRQTARLCRAARGRAMVAATGRAKQRALHQPAYAAAGLQPARIRHHHAVQAHGLYPGQPPHQPRAGRSRPAMAGCAKARAHHRLVLRAGQLHPAHRHAGARSAGH